MELGVNRAQNSVDKCGIVCSHVFMSNVHVSLRLDGKLVAEMDADAKRLERSRNWVISRRLENSRTLPPLWKVDGATGEITQIPEIRPGAELRPLREIDLYSEKKSRESSAGAVAGAGIGGTPCLSPMGKREIPDNLAPIPRTPELMASLREIAAGKINNVKISPAMGADGNFADICSACWGKGTIAGCAECGVVLGGDQEEVVLPRCSHVEYCEDGESYGCSRELGHKGKCVRGGRVEV